MKSHFSRILAAISAVLLSFALIWGVSIRSFAKNAPKHITIIYTNDTLGTLEPCGCHGANSGGTPRRATYIKKVLNENPNAIIVESGNLAFAVNPAQPTAQLEAVAKSLKACNYTAVGVGPTDLQQFGNKFYEVMKKAGVTVVQVDNEQRSDVEPFLIKDVDGVRVGIVSFGAVQADKRNEETLADKRAEALKKVRAQCDILVLLDQGKVATDEWLEKTAPGLGAPDVLIGGCTRTDITDAKSVGETLVVPTSVQGKYVGRIDIEIDGENRKMSFYRQYIDPALQEDAEVAKIVRDYTISQSVQPNNPAVVTGVTAEVYYPYTSCAMCHPNEVEQWKGTRHSGALKTLLAKQKAIPDCLPCHSNMYKTQKRIAIGPDATGGIECMACHANVLPHGEENKKKSDTEYIKKQCANCHTAEKSPGFDINTAYEKVRHDRK